MHLLTEICLLLHALSTDSFPSVSWNVHSARRATYTVKTNFISNIPKHMFCAGLQYCTTTTSTEGEGKTDRDKVCVCVCHFDVGARTEL